MLSLLQLYSPITKLYKVWTKICSARNFNFVLRGKIQKNSKYFSPDNIS